MVLPNVHTYADICFTSRIQRYCNSRTASVEKRALYVGLGDTP